LEFTEEDRKIYVRKLDFFQSRGDDLNGFGEEWEIFPMSYSASMDESGKKSQWLAAQLKLTTFSVSAESQSMKASGKRKKYN